MESVQGRTDGALGPVLHQTDGQMGVEANSKTGRRHSHLLKQAKAQKEKETAIQQNTSVIKYVPTNRREEAVKFLLCSLTMPVT